MEDWPPNWNLSITVGERRKRAFEWLAGGCLGAICDPVLALEAMRWQTVILPAPNHASL